MPKIKQENNNLIQDYRGKKNSLAKKNLGELYIQIWIQKMYFHLSDWDLAKKFECSYGKIKKALMWVNKNFIKLPNKTLLQGAIFSIEERVQHLTTLIEEERDRKTPSVRSIIELNREIREDSRDLLKLRNLYHERYAIEVDGGISIRNILKELTNDKSK